MQEDPKVLHLCRFPVKSFPPMPEDEITVLADGRVLGDREFAFVDTKGNFLNGKRTDKIHGIKLTCDAIEDEPEGHYDFHINDRSFAYPAEKRDIEKWMNELLGEECELIHFQDNDPDALNFTDDHEASGPTIIGIDSLWEVGRWFVDDLGNDKGGLINDLRLRFRSNIELGWIPPFWEDRLFGETPEEEVRFRIGEVEFIGTNPCQRCVVPSRNPLTGEKLPNFVKKFKEQREATLPDWTWPQRFDHYYRLGVNTRVASVPKGGGKVRFNDPIEIL